jgi:DNA-binding beta-propeller fold protein YncE
MRRSIVACLGFAALFFLATSPGMAQNGQRATAQNVPEIPFESVPNFLQMPPDVYLGESMGVARNSKGNLWVYHRRDDTRLFEFDPTGKFVREWGVGIYGFEFAHKVRVDSEDNVWVVDEGSNMVIKFNPEGKVVMVLGRRPEAIEGMVPTPQGDPPTDERYIFARPTDVGWDPQGNIFVSDGYINHRVVKFDKNGRFIRKVGSNLRGSEPYQFNTPHGLALDAQGNVYVADRGNARIQVFDNNLTLRAIYDNVGNPWEVCISPGPHQYLFSSNSNPDSNTPASSWDTSGEIYKMELDGRIVGKFGKAGKAVGQFQTVHGIDCRNPDELIVGEISAWRVQKIRLKAPAPQTAGAN